MRNESNILSIFQVSNHKNEILIYRVISIFNIVFSDNINFIKLVTIYIHDTRCKCHFQLHSILELHHSKILFDVICRRKQLSLTIILIYHISANYKVYIRTRTKFFQIIGLNKIICIHKADKFPLCLIHSSIACSSYTFVVTTQQTNSIIFLRILGTDLVTIVDRPIIHQNQFPIIPRLIQDRIYTIT